jgi:CMP-N,N'-diacetyllegionaminic acid synthase
MAWKSQRVLAVVPARCGSKGIADKNLQILGDKSLIGWAGHVLARTSLIDQRVISTDSPQYAEEGERYGLDAPFLRPAVLSSDVAGAVETIQHALTEVERAGKCRFDVVLIIEPTSPMRVPGDLERATDLLISSGADSVVTVSRLDDKYHPQKIFSMDSGVLRYYDEAGAGIIRRQQLAPLYFRNGICYALTRRCLVEQGRIITANTLGLLIERAIVNIDTPIDLAWARFLLGHQAAAGEEL